MKKAFKPSDFYMQNKFYSMHVRRIQQIASSKSPYKDEYPQQQQHLKRIAAKRKEEKNRKNYQIYEENIGHSSRLCNIEYNYKGIQSQYLKRTPELKYSSQPGFNSYFNNKKSIEKIRKDNLSFITRMTQKCPIVPKCDDLNRSFKAHKKYSRNIQKLPQVSRYDLLYNKQSKNSSIGVQSKQSND